jgi:glutamate racemase
VEAIIRDGLAPLLGERNPSGEFVFPLPASARIDTLLLGCTHYPLLRAAIAAVAGDRIAIVDSATATASALSELLLINGLEAPGSSRGTAADAGRAGHDAPPSAEAPPSHLQLTTGDVARFHAIAGRMFGSEFPDVAGIVLGSSTDRAAWPREAVGS